MYLKKLTWSVCGLVNFPAAAGRIRMLIGEFRPDVVVIPNIDFAVSVLQVLPKSLPVVLHVHDVPDRHWSSWMGRYVVARTTGIVTVSDFIRDKVIAVLRNPMPVITVHNGVPLVEPAEAPLYPKLRVGIIGQSIPRKKHDVLVEAVHLLSLEDRSQLEVRIYGANTTAYAQEIVQRIEVAGLTGCFRWMGFLGSPAEIYHNLDVVVAPAINEPFGTTVLEAGGWGLPVIAARSGGFPEMVLDGETGLLVEANDPADLARALKRLMRSAERDALGRAARRHIAEHFSTGAMGRNFIGALNSFGLVM